ncbi:MAG: nucleotidyltransferase substrate binding protein [Candidatus Hydrogenedentes bacterium]|nr:nucleotidyltransferase substrate binding protein [Candidatus Hydrogenedentota bacterium]
MGIDETRQDLRLALDALHRAMEHEAKALTDDFYFGGISKAFEVAVEYGWKYLRACVTAEGLEVYSPKEAVRLAGQVRLIGDVDASGSSFSTSAIWPFATTTPRLQRNTFGLSGIFRPLQRRC